MIIKLKYLDLIRSGPRKLINFRYKSFDWEDLFLLKVKSDIRDRETLDQVGETIVRYNVKFILATCNELEAKIESP